MTVKEGFIILLIKADFLYKFKLFIIVQLDKVGGAYGAVGLFEGGEVYIVQHGVDKLATKHDVGFVTFVGHKPCHVVCTAFFVNLGYFVCQLLFLLAGAGDGVYQDARVWGLVKKLYHLVI